MKVKGWKKFQHFKDRRPPWVKLYRDLLDDPDWHELDGDSAKALVMIWLIASENEGELPDARKLAFRLRTSETKAKQILIKLSHWLVQDDIETISDRYHDDTPETETEGDKETEEDIRAVAVATRPCLDQAFDDFWKAYPKRDGANPKEPAKKKFKAAVKSGCDPGTITEAARRYRSEVQAKGQEGTPYVVQAMRWLSQRRWGDYAATAPPEPAAEFVPPPGAPTREELLRFYRGEDDEGSADGGSVEGVARAGADLFRKCEDGSEDGPPRHSPGRNRVGAMQSLGSVLQRSPGLDASGSPPLSWEERGADGCPDGMAAMVRRDIH